MNSQLISFLNLLDFDRDDILSEQRQAGAPCTPFEMEKQLLLFVAEGKPDEMAAFYKEMFPDQSDLRFSVGKLSQDKLRRLKYLAVSTIALVCRMAMYGGVAESVAYARSDKAIQKIDRMNNPDRILTFTMTEVYRYAQLVAQNRKNEAYSKAVRDSIDYITANLHSNITLDDLAQFSPQSKEYFAKVFKKEVGKTVSDYILEQRIREAQKMIEQGETSREISHFLHFCSQSYFIKQFKKVTGLTPQEYRVRQSTGGEKAAT